MKTYILSATAVAFSLALIMPASAQEVDQDEVQTGETAPETAQTAGTTGMTGGLGTAAAIGGGVVVLGLALGGAGGGSDEGVIPPSGTN